MHVLSMKSGLCVQAIAEFSGTEGTTDTWHDTVSVAYGELFDVKAIVATDLASRLLLPGHASGGIYGAF